MNINDAWNKVGSPPYRKNPDGTVTWIDNGWKKKNIVRVSTNRMNFDRTQEVYIWVNRLIEEQTYHLFKEPCWDSFVFEEWGGYVPRCQMWSFVKPLSLHALGLAIDVNWSKFPYGGKTRFPDEIVAAIKKHGMVYGGDWKSRDNHHFEIKDLQE